MGREHQLEQERGNDTPRTGEPESQGTLDALRTLASQISPDLEDFPRLPQQARSREKRKHILEAAAVLFAERGYAGSTADDIAVRAGVSVGTFYSYFRNKRQVLLAIVMEQLEDIFGSIQLTHIDFGSGNDREAIHSAVSKVLERSHAQLWRVWMELYSQDATSQPYQDLIRQYVLNQLQEKLKIVVQQGKAWPNLDIEMTALAIFALIDSVNLHFTSAFDRTRMIDALTDICYRIIFPPVELQAL
jgi:TetR/AcrR family transcriptional regulator, mexJK operon transcriptional repressor